MTGWINARKKLPTERGYYFTHEQIYFRQEIVDLLGMVKADPEHFVRFFDGKNFVTDYNERNRLVAGLPINKKILYWRYIPKPPRAKAGV